MKKNKTGLIIIDLLILVVAYVVTAGLKPVMVSYLSNRYLIGFGVMVVLWIFSSFYLGKYAIIPEGEPPLPDPQYYSSQPGGTGLCGLYHLCL